MADSNRHIVVTGTSSGIGRAIAHEARRRGWSVLGTVRRESDRSALAADGIETAVCDITDAAAVADLGSVVDEWSAGRLDALVNNAGTTYAAPVEEMDLDDIRAQFEVNVVGHIAVTQAMLPLLRAARGTVVMISSDSATRTPPLLGAYAASKRAIEAFGEALDLETSDQGVRTLVVRPAAYESSIWETTMDRAAKYERDDSRYGELADKVKARALDAARRRPASELAEHTLDSIERPRSPFLRTVPRTFDNTVTRLVPWSTYKALVRRVLGQ